MKIPWKKIADRIDDLTLRERAMIFASVVLLLVALPYSMVVTPSLAKQKSFLDRVRQDQSQIESVQREIQILMASQSDALGSENRQKLKGLERDLAEIEKQLTASESRLVSAEKMPELIRGVLKRSSRLQLVSLQAIPGTPMIAEAGEPAAVAPGVATAAGKAAPAAKPAAVDSGLFKRGIEITVRGTYLDLLQFLGEMEQGPWRLLWGKVHIATDQYPAVTMKATIFTLSKDSSAVSL